MKTDPNARFSDLDHAKAITRTLRPDENHSPARPGSHAATGYVKFKAHRPAPAMKEPLEKPNLPPPLVGEYGADAWNTLLAWVAQLQGASQVFVIDGRGLVVAHYGPFSSEEVERAGARLQLALDQACKLTPDAETVPTVCFELGAQWLSGFPISLEAGEVAVLGLLGPTAVTLDVRVAIEQGLRQARSI